MKTTVDELFPSHYHFLPPPLLLLLLISPFLQPSHSMTLRIHEKGFEDLSEYTRQWMADTVASNALIRKHCHKLGSRLALDGQFVLENITVTEFTAPRVKYSPSKNSLLYISTDEGYIEGKIRGFSSDISVKVTKNNEFSLHQCVARFDDFFLELNGSLAADILHWFHRPLAKAMQSRVEETYCDLMNELLPWLRSQFEKFPRRLQIEFSNNMVLVQVLQNITTGDGYLDLQMTNQLKTAYGLIESADEPAPKSEFTNKEEDRTKVELFVGENTLQQLLSVSHRSNLFVTNFTSPFLTTKCALFCIGKLVPQMKSLPVVSLFAVIRTNQAPTVKLVENRIQVMTNISFEIFDDAFQQQYDSSSTKESGREEVVGGHQEIVVVGMKNDDDDDEGITGNEKQPENNEEVSNQQRKRNKRSQESRHPEEDKLRRKQKSSSETATIEEDLYATTPSSVEERQEEEDGEETGEGASFRKLAPWTRPLPKQSLLSRPGSSKLIPHVRPVPPGTEQIPGGGGSPEWGESVFGQSSRKAGQVIWPKVVVVGATTSTTMDTPTRNWTWTLPPSPTEPIIFEETTTTTPPTTTTMAEIITTSTTAIQPQQPTQTLRPIVIKVGRPILRIDIHSKVELAIAIQNRRIHSELKLSDVQAKLAESQIQEMSQRTIDLIVDTSVPFLENSVRIFYRDGIVLDELFQLPVKNATIRIREKFIQLRADFNLLEMLI